jgi:hypothetical protein
MRVPQLLVVLVGLSSMAAPASADVQSFFFHFADPAAAVPGGTSSYVLDDIPPPGSPPLVFEQTTPKDETTAFPTFTSTPFAAGTTLMPIASVRMYLAANQKMRSCAAASAAMTAVGTDGATTAIGGTTRVDATVLQGSAGGTVGAGLLRVEFPLTDTSFAPGEGFAVTTSFTNDCSINRRTFLAYDGGDSRTGVRFQCCFTTAAKCAAKKITLAAKAAKGYLNAVAKGSSRGRPTDPVTLEKIRSRLTSDFAKREASGLCQTTNDAAATLALIEDFAAEIDAALDPLGPTRESQCQYKKISAVGTRAG